jgi:hypothetical protein
MLYSELIKLTAAKYHDKRKKSRGKEEKLTTV